MSHTVVLPALGESVTEGTVTRWLVEVGDTIEVDAPLVEVSTDKVDTEVPSPVAGVVEQILVPEDEDVEVGAALAIIGDGSGAAAPAAPAAAEAPAAPAPVARLLLLPQHPPLLRLLLQLLLQALRSYCPHWASPSPRAPLPAG